MKNRTYGWLPDIPDRGTTYIKRYGRSSACPQGRFTVSGGVILG
ncbi:MAG: hypothetical protein WA066_01480 [Candidatus Omnitrophota bacterium]